MDNEDGRHHRCAAGLIDPLNVVALVETLAAGAGAGNMDAPFNSLAMRGCSIPAR